MKKQIKHYEISTMQDIADAVTPENAARFMEDFHKLIGMLLIVKETSKVSVAKGMATEEEARVEFPGFTWIDDDKGEYKADLISKQTGETTVVDFNPIIQAFQDSPAIVDRSEKPGGAAEDL